MSGDGKARDGAYEVITPPNKLKAKVGVGKGIDPKMLERAQKLVDSMAGDFEERAVEEASAILSLADLVENRAEADEEDRVGDMFRIGHELKGQGGTFGYPLISRIGGSLCRYIESLEDHGAVDLDVIRAHAMALRVVASQKICGDGGPVEKELVGELDRLIVKKAPA
ncbi:MAG: hypothetical protein VW644_00980 [Alphaproteobacteria bacterium]|jgi:hypothetical protein